MADNASKPNDAAKSPTGPADAATAQGHQEAPGQAQPAAGQAPPVQSQVKAGATTAPATATAGQPAKSGSPAVDPNLVHTLATTMALIQAQQGAPAMAHEDQDETHEGGRYIVDGRVVNAWGGDFKEGQSAHDDNPELTRFNRPR